MSQLVLDKLVARFGADIIETHSQRGDDTAVIAKERWVDAARFLRTDPELAFELFVDLCAVDFPGRSPRLEVVLHLYSVSKQHRIRMKTRIGDAELTDVDVDSIVSVYPGANWLERETFDMFGVNFLGHPDLRRILLYPEFVGYPLRKDYQAQKTQPLVAYREADDVAVPIDKLTPFGDDEGMSFARKVWLPKEER